MQFEIEVLRMMVAVYMSLALMAALVWQLEVEVAHNQAIHSAILGCALAV